jgi:hypothetical protein
MEPATSNVSSESASNKANLERLSSEKKSLHLLDLYSGCGGMSTGLCLGAALSGINLETVSSVLSQYKATKITFVLLNMDYLPLL